MEAEALKLVVRKLLAPLGEKNHAEEAHDLGESVEVSWGPVGVHGMAPLMQD